MKGSAHRQHFKNNSDWRSMTEVRTKTSPARRGYGFMLANTSKDSKLYRTKDLIIRQIWVWVVMSHITDGVLCMLDWTGNRQKALERFTDSNLSRDGKKKSVYKHKRGEKWHTRSCCSRNKQLVLLPCERLQGAGGILQHSSGYWGNSSCRIL